MDKNIQLIRAAMLNVYCPTLKVDLEIAIRRYRNFVKSDRNGDFNHVKHWDCGRQDAWGDKIDSMVFSMRAAILAYAIKNGDTRRLKKLVDEID